MAIVSGSKTGRGKRGLRKGLVRARKQHLRGNLIWSLSLPRQADKPPPSLLGSNFWLRLKVRTLPVSHQGWHSTVSPPCSQACLFIALSATSICRGFRRHLLPAHGNATRPDKPRRLALQRGPGQTGCNLSPGLRAGSPSSPVGCCPLVEAAPTCPSISLGRNHRR